ncbi:hypothetical protein [Rufibacter sp. LB8]|uniref:hypothetical protein n=1 Tax=Rufibacter sp. LB8 TaxID=2777781 RepID=UPI00351C1063
MLPTTEEPVSISCTNTNTSSKEVPQMTKVISQLLEEVNVTGAMAVKMNYPKILISTT